MSSFIVNATNTSGETGTIIPDVSFHYYDSLNEINEANIKISGSSSTKRSLIEIGTTIKIYRDGVLAFYGLVRNVDYFDGGGMSINLDGYEKWLALESGSYAGSPYASTASATIFSAIIGESTKFTAGTIEAGTSVDFRIYQSDSLWNAISNLTTATQQDISIDYTALTVGILDHKGSSTSVGTFNSGIQIGDVRVTQAYPTGNKILVYGKGDGDNQIKSEYPSHGYDAASQTSYGVLKKVINDPKITSVAQANIVADAELAKYKSPIKNYDFNVFNPNNSIVSGDVITLNATDQGLSNEEVRVVKVERGMEGKVEVCSLEVTNKEYSQTLKDSSKKISEQEKLARDKETYMQGTTNILTFSQMINAKSTAPLRILAYLPSDFIEDEVGNLRVNSFTLDYDVDPYRRDVGTATETNVAPVVEDDSENTGGDYVTGSSGTMTEMTYLGQDLNYSESCASGDYTTMLEFTPGVGNVDQDLFIQFGLSVDSGGPEDVVIMSSGGTHLKAMSWDSDSFDGFGMSAYLPGGVGSSTEKVVVIVYPITGAITLSGGLYVYKLSHNHGIGTYASVDHVHGPGGYNSVSHNHGVEVGDAVSDSALLNATSVDIYLDFWNTGTSTWDNKYSILNTGKTLDYDVDISNSGVYPDAPGYWRVRIYTNDTDPDLVQGIIKVKHELDT
jgi:hypothetical protein